MWGGGTKAGDTEAAKQADETTEEAQRAGSDVTRTDLVEGFLRDPAEVHAVVAGGSHFHLGSRTPPLQGRQQHHRKSALRRTKATWRPGPDSLRRAPGDLTFDSAAFLPSWTPAADEAR